MFTFCTLYRVLYGFHIVVRTLRTFKRVVFLSPVTLFVLATMPLHQRILFPLQLHVVLLEQLQEVLGPILVVAAPDVAQLRHRPEDRPLELVDVVAELVGVLDELGLLRGDGQLHFRQQSVSVDHVDEDVPVAGVEAVLDPDDLERAFFLLTESLELGVDADDFFFAGRSLRSDEVTDREGEKVRCVIFCIFLVSILILYFLFNDFLSFIQTIVSIYPFHISFMVIIFGPNYISHSILGQ